MAKPAPPGGKPAAGAKELGDDTAALVRWRDIIGREMKALKKFDHTGGFVISDPRKLKSVTPKIGEVDKSHDPLAATRRAEEVESLKKTLADASRLPKEKNKRPVTAGESFSFSSHSLARKAVHNGSPRYCSFSYQPSSFCFARSFVFVSALLVLSFVSAAQEVGWFAELREDEVFKATTKSCAEVAFATAFFESEGRGLFHRDPAAAAAAAKKSPGKK